MVFEVYGSTGIFNSSTTMRPVAVVPTSGLPSGVGAKPPDCSSKQDRTKAMAAGTSLTEPPVYFSTLTADEVAPRLDGPPGVEANPPSAFWRAAVQEAVWAVSEGVGDCAP